MQSTFASTDLGFGTVSCHCCFTDCVDNASEAGNAVFCCHSALSHAVLERLDLSAAQWSALIWFSRKFWPFWTPQKKLRLKYPQGQEGHSHSLIPSLHILGCARSDAQVGNAPGGFAPLHPPHLLQTPSLGTNSWVSYAQIPSQPVPRSGQ